MSGRKNREMAERARADAARQVAEMKEEVAKMQARVDIQRQEYEDFEFENPYTSMENVFEDLTVNQEAAQFQVEQGDQQRANILQQLRGAAGASGVAGLAQTLAQQGTIQARQISADIAQQHQRNQQLALGQAQQIDLLGRQGEQMVGQAEFGREATLLGMDYGQLTGANQGLQQGYSNQMAAYGMAAQMESARMGMFGNILGGVASGIGQAGGIGAFFGSERKLKRNITLVGKSPNGLNIYNFEYINPKHGEGVYQGVISDEVPKEAVLNHPDGYEMVDYSLIDVNFKKIK